MTNSVAISRQINAVPERLYDMVADLPRMGEWSPENRGGRWVKGATGAAVGAVFEGVNGGDGAGNRKRSWKTRSTVVVADRPSAFAFEVKAGPLKVARWGYSFEPVDGATQVTETWTDQRGWLITKLGGVLTGVADRASYNRQAMEATLTALAASAEAAA